MMEGNYDPTTGFKDFAEWQKGLLRTETDTFFKRHGLRIRKYIFPEPLPAGVNSFNDVIRDEEVDPFSSIYRHKQFLKSRVLRNWSYIETVWNRGDDVRNRNIPFDLRPVTSEIIKQLDTINEDMMDSEFAGLMMTVNTCQYPCNIEGKSDMAMTKVIAGAIVECLDTNERCIRCIWVHPALTKRSSRILLQAFLPRLLLETFDLPSVVDETGKKSNYNKFVYAMHNDLDLCPRQCWLLLASAKKMSLPRHYEPSTFEDHPVDLEYGDCHTDEAGHLLLDGHDKPTCPKVIKSVGTEMSARNVACSCRREKMKKSHVDQAWLDRLVGCTESYMCLLLPKRGEREGLRLIERDGWRDLVLDGMDPILFSELLDIIPERGRAHMREIAVKNQNHVAPVRANANFNGDSEEWCRLRREDLIDVTSDTEVYMKKPKASI